jgi:integrase/recombinase XerD
MNTFEDYLRYQGISTSSSARMLKSLGYIQNLSGRTSLEIEEAGYNDLLIIATRMKKRGLKPRTINLYFGVIRHYFEYLKFNGLRDDNPAESITIKGTERGFRHKRLKPELLNELYKAYPATTAKQHMEKVVIGLLTYQGLTITELAALEIQHINLESGNIRIPETRKSNGRVVALASNQILPLVKYLELHRAVIVQKKPEALQSTKKLIVTAGSSFKINNLMKQLIKEIRSLQPEIINYHQIRYSVIAQKVNKGNLRQMQEYFGFKYVDSVEQYLEGDTEELMDELDRFFVI